MSSGLYLNVVNIRKRQIKVKWGINYSVRTNIILPRLHLFAQYGGSPLGYIKN